jgi:hypothetical protein
MNPTIESIRAIRLTLNLQPREKMIEYLNKRITELIEQKARQGIIEIGQQALQDLRHLTDELSWLTTLCYWVQSSTQEPDPELRAVYAQIGAFLMCTAV